MRTSLMTLLAGGAVLLGGCASQHHTDHFAGTGSQTQVAWTRGYDDRRIAEIQRGKTAEAQLVEWFGRPQSRELKPDGQMSLTWSLDAESGDGGGNGNLSVILGPERKVEAYSARGAPAVQRRTVEFVEKSDTDVRERMDKWAREGWSVRSISARLPQADGTIHRKAELSRVQAAAAASRDYDDEQIARICGGETTGAQLSEWFGPASSRQVSANGRTHVGWTFADSREGGGGAAGELSANLSPDGKVESYSAHRGSH